MVHISDVLIMNNQALPPALALVAVAAITHLWYRSRRTPPLPPGPSGHWFFGNALEASTPATYSAKFAGHEHPKRSRALVLIENDREVAITIARAPAFYHKITEYTDQHGPFITIRLLQRYAFVISDPQLVTELFEKRAANYSDKEENEMVKLTGWSTDLVFFQYGPQFRRYRAILNRATNNRAAQDYIPLQQHEVKKLIKRIAEDPERFLDHIRLLAASIAIRIAYGYQVKSFEDPFVTTAERHMQGFGDCTQPWNWMVNVFTPLRYLPDWLPIAPFQRRVKEVKDIILAHREKPFAYVQEQIAAGTAERSFVAKLLQPEDGSIVDDEMKEEIKSIAGTFYGGGADTTVSIIQSFFLAMILYPEAQAKSQKEIDSYFLKQAEAGKPRTILDPGDRPSLPYTSALVRELQRWHPIAPVIFHRSGPHDDNNVIYEGKTYRIPARSLVMCNIW
ncbi:cytochrome P450 family protein [Ceratobasidium sp. AG-Ba]|nr:cytochrome P450 family protein [Ceratobasidium sp. AG-Ba]